MIYTIYDKATGKIKRNVSCHESARDIQAQDGEEIINGKFESTEFKFVKGKPAKLTQSEKEPLAVEGERSRLISARMKKILKEMAIKELKKEGLIE